MHYLIVLSTRRPISFISGLNIKDIDGIINHNNCHHVLNKKDYDKFRLYDRNIILITKYEHHLIHNGTEEQREIYVKEVMSEYGVVVHWEKLEELKQILINDYFKAVYVALDATTGLTGIISESLSNAQRYAISPEHNFKFAIK